VLTFGGKIDVSRIAGRHAVKAGVDAVLLQPDEDLAYDYSGFRELSHDLGLEHFHVEDDVISFAGRETGGQVSAYVQDTIQLSDRVSADVGFRLDQYEIVVSATHLSPRVNLAFQVGGGAVVHASYNHFFVPPPIEGLLSTSAGLTEQIEDIGVPLPPLEPTTEDQLELGATGPVGPVRLGLTGYYRASDNQVHTTVWPDARLYSYASFDRAEAYGLEARADVLGLARYGMTGYFNYALGRVEFWNPVTGGFITESDHLTEADSFLAPMDQTHTLTAGATYRHAPSGLWAGTAIEYGSGTPMGHGGGHDHAEAGEEGHDEGEHGTEGAGHDESTGAASRVPGHFTADLSFGIDVLRDESRQPRLSFQIDIRNIGDNVYLIAQEGVFTPGQYYIPRLISATAKVRF
jgi:outer membrane receptor protein involved in Fe transport